MGEVLDFVEGVEIGCVSGGGDKGGLNYVWLVWDDEEFVVVV